MKTLFTVLKVRICFTNKDLNRMYAVDTIKLGCVFLLKLRNQLYVFCNLATNITTTSFIEIDFSVFFWEVNKVSVAIRNFNNIGSGLPDS